MISISTWNYLKTLDKKANLEEHIIEIGSQGFGLELWLGWTVDKKIFQRSNWENIKKLCSGFQKISAHTSQTKSFSYDALLSEMDLCTFIGADPLVCHPKSLGLSPGTWDYKSGIKLTGKEKELIGKILAEAHRRSLHIALENGPLDILEQVITSMENHQSFSQLGICIDTGHAQMHSRKSRSPVTEIIASLGKHLIHLHVHDNNGLKDDHLVPGEGTCSWQDIFDELKKVQYRGEIVFELNSPEPAKAAKKAESFIRRFYPEINR